MVSTFTRRKHVSGRDPVSPETEAICDHPLLTPDEEAALGQRIVAGREAVARLKSGKFPPQSRKRLEEVAADAEQAKQTLIGHNYRLALWISRTVYGLTADDRFQAGVKGLLIAVEKWEPDRARFTTYATWWAWQSTMREVMDNGLLIRLPVHQQERILAIQSARNSLWQKHHRRPTAEEIAAEYNGRHNARLTAKQVKETLLNVKRLTDPASLDAPLSSEGEEGDTLFDMVADLQTVEDAVEPDGAAQAAAEAVISMLPKKSMQDALRAYAALGGDDNKVTLDQVGRKLGVSHERARQLINMARSYLLHPARLPKVSRELRAIGLEPPGKIGRYV